MKWGIYDDYTIRNIKPTEKNSVLIRILEPRYKESGIPYEIKYLNKYSAVLNLYFDDITSDFTDRYEDRFIKFDESMAIKFIDFITSQNIDEINIHCNKGSSRSSALMYCAALILEDNSIINEIENDTYYNPNKQVLNVFKNTFNQ